MTVWFVKGVGLVKYSERQMIPNPRTGKDRLIEITEELQEATLQGGTQLLRGRKASTHGVLTGQPLCCQYPSPPALVPTPESRCPPKGCRPTNDPVMGRLM